MSVEVKALMNAEISAIGGDHPFVTQVTARSSLEARQGCAFSHMGSLSICTVQWWIPTPAIAETASRRTR